MKKHRIELRREVKELLNEALTAESIVKVWGSFETVLKDLDRTLLMVMRRYFAGASCIEIAKRLQITEEQAVDLIRRGKRQLVERLRRRCKVRQ